MRYINPRFTYLPDSCYLKVKSIAHTTLTCKMSPWTRSCQGRQIHFTRFRHI